MTAQQLLTELRRQLSVMQADKPLTTTDLWNLLSRTDIEIAKQNSEARHEG